MIEFTWPKRVAALLFFGLVTALAIAQLSPPEPLGADAPAQVFSATRALAHLRHIARAPHPIGSAEHDAVRDYLLATLTQLGVAPSVEVATVPLHEHDAQLELYRVENVVARLRGTGGSRQALLLMAHYDSVPTGPGAADDGHAVAALLETLRALKAGPALERDILFLFTDGEELGLLGAEAFAAASPERGDVAVAINFEARGTRGPAFLFETSAGGSGLARELGRVAPYPMASSLLDEIYRRLPNDTDLSVARRAGLPGMNFAFFDDYLGYHSRRDDLAALDPASVQHQGSYALALARAFGRGDLDTRSAPDASYFNLTGRWLIAYPAVVTPLALALAVLGLAWLLVRGCRRGHLRVRGLAIGAGCAVASLLLWPTLIHHAWSLVAPLLGPDSPTGDAPDARFYRLGAVALSVAGTLGLFVLALRRAHRAELAFGALAILLGLAALAVVLVPGGAYLLVWPSLCGVIGCSALARAPSDAVSAARRALFWLGGAVAIWLLAPWIHLLFVLLTLHQVRIAAAVTVVLTSFVAPQLLVAVGAWRWRAPTAIALIGAASLLVGAASAGRSAHPAVDSVGYALDVDVQQAHWISDQVPADAWVSRLIPDAVHRTALDGFFPFTDWTFYRAPAAVAAIAPPDLRVLDSRVDGGVRTLRLRVQSGRGAERVLVYAPSTAVRSVVVDGQRFDGQRTSDTARWALRYQGAPGGSFELTLAIDASAALSLRVVDQYFGLARAVPPPRPPEVIETPSGFGPGDQTYVGKTFADLEAPPVTGGP